MLKKRFATIFILAAFWASSSTANIVITGTRVIYPSDAKNVSVQLTNVGDSPSLVQAWIDDGDANTPPEKIQTPFVITPPISRVDGNKGQTLRLIYTGESLPSDRESLFYLNVLDIPPSPKDKSKNYLQIALRSRIKLFYRPANLPLSPSEAYAKVKWQLKGKQLQVDNPTPYYITYVGAGVGQGKNMAKTSRANMIAPFSKAVFELNKVPSGKDTTVQWDILNDYGSDSLGSSPLQY